VLSINWIDREAFGQSAFGQSTIIVHQSTLYIYWGVSKMDDVGSETWDLFDSSIAYLTEHKNPNTLHVALFVYKYSRYLLGDGKAIRDHLVVLGVPAIDVYPQGAIDQISVAPYDLVLYWNGFGYPLDRAVATGVPIMSVAPVHTRTMGIGSGEVKSFEPILSIQLLANFPPITNRFTPGVLDVCTGNAIATQATGLGIPIAVAAPERGASASAETSEAETGVEEERQRVRRALESGSRQPRTGMKTI